MAVTSSALVAQAGFVAASVAVAVVTPLTMWSSAELAAVDAHAISWVAMTLVASVVTFAATTFSAVAFIVFLHRARTNLGPGLRWAPGWTIGGWFIPLANMVIPLLVVREIARDRKVFRVWPFRMWAVCWTLYLLLAQANAVRDAVAFETALEPTAGMIAAELVAVALFVAAGIAGIVMIRRIALDQERLVSASPIPVGPPVDLPGRAR